MEFNKNTENYALSNLHGIEEKYYLKDHVRIVDPKQYKLYIKNNVFPIDMYTTYDESKDMDILVMIFKKSETAELYTKWKNRELE